MPGSWVLTFWACGRTPLPVGMRGTGICRGVRLYAPSYVVTMLDAKMTDKPKLRPLQAIPYQAQGEQLVCLRDPSGLTNKSAVLPPRVFFLAAMCDGDHTLRDIQAEYMRRFGELVMIETIESVVKQLDEALLLEGERVEAHRREQVESFARAPKRRAMFAGQAYPAQAAKLRAFLNGFFDGKGGPGAPDRAKRESGVVAAIAPHISPELAGAAYAHAWKEIAERCAAETFVVLGVAHSASKSAYVVTEKDFETPLGEVPCDKAFARDLRRRAGLDDSGDELLHRNEHSIEFQAVFLRHVFGASRPARIVPVLCGPLLEAVGDGDPAQSGPARDFAGALREIIEEQEGRAAVIASVDLSHVGKKFGDAADLGPDLLAWLETEDRALLGHAEAVNAAHFFDHNRREGDRRHVCGFSAIYTLLASVPAARGRLLHYGQAPEAETQSVVSFAAMAFDRA